MIKVLVIYPFLYSFLEWNVHCLLHVRKSSRHTTHHVVLRSEDDYKANFRKSLMALLAITPVIFMEPAFISMWINYVMYEFFHSWLHRNKGGAASYHAIHHFSKNWNKNYGVLSPFWDAVFGTMRTKSPPKWWEYLYNWNPYLFFINF